MSDGCLRLFPPIWFSGGSAAKFSPRSSNTCSDESGSVKRRIVRAFYSPVTGSVFRRPTQVTLKTTRLIACKVTRGMFIDTEFSKRITVPS